MNESAAATPRLMMTGITKRFGGVHALEDVRFTSHAGQVHALCGENGAGKSTLMKILAGVIVDYDGILAIDGETRQFRNTREAEEAGIRIIHQELNLVPDLSVAANIFLGEEITGRFGLLSERAMNQRAAEVLSRLGARIDPRARVRDLRIGDQQMVEIAKAIAFRAEIVIMDEPTSALSDAEVARLFRVIGDLKAANHAVIYISHKMNEVFRLADQVTVLRDGRLVTSVPAAEASPTKVVQWMVGRALAGDSPRKNSHIDQDSDPILEISDLNVARDSGSGRPSLSNVNLTVRKGEIVGIAGLLGAGRTELLESIFGVDGSQHRTGEIRLKGEPVRFRNPHEAIAAGVAMVTEDRKNLGLFAEMNVGENITITELGESPISRAGIVRQRIEAKAANEEISRLRIKTPSRRSMILSLSGGNQQKAILGRWLLTEPELLLLDEPTRGIDVGAKAEIHALLRDLADSGLSVLVTSSELPELFAVADRIVVMCEGRVTDDMPRSEATEERIMAAATAFLDKGVLAES
jgi:ABC-type sugar transport system ATPase subunit